MGELLVIPRAGHRLHIFKSFHDHIGRWDIDSTNQFLLGLYWLRGV